jgi:putative ABC transport system permease protein
LESRGLEDVDREVVEELAQHLEAVETELMSSGLAEAEAAARALAELDDDAMLSRELRGKARRSRREMLAPGVSSGRSAGALGWMWQDVRYAARVLRKRPLATMLAVLTLALGIGGNTAVFSVVNAVLMKPLPFAQPDRLVTYLYSAPDKGLPELYMTQAQAVFNRERLRMLAPVTVFSSTGFNLTGQGEAERLTGTNVSWEFFDVVGRQPAHGRGFRPEEDTPGRNLVAVLSDALWRRRFGADAAIVGQTIVLNDIPTTVVGIMPPGFEFPRGSELWIPIGLNRENLNSWYLLGLGRLKPGVTLENAQKEIASQGDDFALLQGFPGARRGRSIALVEPLADRLVGDVRPLMLVVVGAVGLVLLIACANIANLSLARVAGRTREIALRCHLGANTRRIASQLLIENLVLAFAGAAVGLGLAYWGIQAIRVLPLEQLPRLEEVRLDRGVLLFTLGITVLTGLLSGLVPAIRGSRIELSSSLKEGARGTASASGRRAFDAFVVVQLALTLVLSVGAGLMLRSFHRLLEVETGFEPANVIVGRLQLPGRRFTSEQAMAFYRRLLNDVDAVRGVQAAGLTLTTPFTAGNPQTEVIGEGREPGAEDPIPVANQRFVTPRYFAAVGTPILRGRVFDERDTETSQPVAIVDETLASHYWPEGEALGKRIRFGGDPATATWMTIVGVVPNVKQETLDETPTLQLYVPLAQRIVLNAQLVVRSSAEPEALAAALRARVAAIDPALPLYDVHMLENALANSLVTRRLANTLLIGFALTAMLLAIIGVYGVMALNVNARLGEFGIRLALGARPGDVVRLVLRRGFLLATFGLAIGLLGAMAATRVLDGLLFGVRRLDPITFAGVALFMLAVAMTACYVPARRAIRADPIDALRAQ